MQLPMTHRNERGMSLTEVLVASIIGLVVIVGIGSIDVTRFRIETKIRNDAGGDAAVEHLRAALATVTIARNLSVADRLYFNDTVTAKGIYQVRTPVFIQNDPVICPVSLGDCRGDTPPACCLDIAANYRWDQYALNDENGGQLTMYSDLVGAGCGQKTDMARQISAPFKLEYHDRGKAPPGGNVTFLPNSPGPTDNRDNNVAGYTVTWVDPVTSDRQTFIGEVTSRDSAYTDVATASQDPNLADVNPPPYTLLSKLDCTDQ